MNRWTIATWAAILFATPILSISARAQEPPPIMEAYPDKIQARIENRDRRLRNAPRMIGGQPLSLVIEKALTWPDRIVTVSFNGGDKSLRAMIAELMAATTQDTTWAQHGGVEFDFGDSDAGYRSWSASDAEYASDIRISLEPTGYWSLVGTDSVDSEIVGTGEASMNLEGFAHSLPDDWKVTTLHEFGHALGFQHEHQSPSGGCDQEFRWEDHPDGTPGIYTVLGGSPNFWPKWKVDHNLRQLQSSDAFTVSPHDPRSIMHYSFPKWMFHRGEQSHCFTEVNESLSDLDQAGMADAYPLLPPPGVAADLVGSSRSKALESLRELSVTSGLSMDQKAKYRRLYERLLLDPEE